MRSSGVFGMTFLALLAVGCEPKVQLLIVTSDDQGRPIASAAVRVDFEHGNDPAKRSTVSGLTDGFGKLTVSSRTSGFAVIGAEKDGFYLSRAKWISDGVPQGIGAKPPTNVIQLKMRRITAPVPLFFRSASLMTAGYVGSASYDLGLGDWLPPNGTGVAPDLRFTWEGRVVAPTNSEGQLLLQMVQRESKFKLAFANPLDGLVRQPFSYDEGSELRLPNLAPEDGYLPVEIWEETSTPGNRPDGEAHNRVAYFLRVRSQTNELGRVRSAIYAKTDGGFELAMALDGTAIRFNYYLNPTPNDRNLEYDGTNNLFEVRAPRER